MSKANESLIAIVTEESVLKNEVFYEIILTNLIKPYIFGIIFVVGLFSNILSLLICLRLRSQSSFRWLSALSLSDIVVNISLTLWMFLPKIENEDFWNKVVSSRFT